MRSSKISVWVHLLQYLLAPALCTARSGVGGEPQLQQDGKRSGDNALAKPALSHLAHRTPWPSSCVQAPPSNPTSSLAPSSSGLVWLIPPIDLVYRAKNPMPG